MKENIRKVAKLLNVNPEDVIVVEESEENLFRYYAILENHSIQKLVTYDSQNNELVAETDIADLLG